jgi:oxygen-independent coproporphyrinogen-3 oxidase
MFERSLERLAEAGYRHYEVSNFARPGREAAHNLIYWKDGEYVGLGCGASQHLDGVRSTNLDRVVPYMDAVEKGRDPVESQERLTGKAKLGEGFMLGLRLIGGFRPTEQMRTAFKAELISLEGRGLIRRSEDVYALTREGVFVANDVFRVFVSPFTSTTESVTP